MGKSAIESIVPDARTGLFSSPSGPVPSVNRSAGWLPQVASHIDALRNLPQNWDSYGAFPVEEASIIAAKAVLERLNRITLVDPSVAATPSGHVNLTWCWDHQSKSLEIEFQSDGSLIYAYVDDLSSLDDREGRANGVSEIEYLFPVK